MLTEDQMIIYLKDRTWLRKRNQQVRGQIEHWTKQNTNLPVNKGCWSKAVQLTGMLINYFVQQGKMKPLYN